MEIAETMKVKTFDDNLWRHCIRQFGFMRGYAVIGIKMLLIACNNRRLLDADRRRKQSLRAYNRQYYLANRERYREYYRRYREANLEHIRERNRAYYWEHKDHWHDYRKP